MKKRENASAKRTLKKYMCIILIVILAACFSGCRQSPVLVDEIYTHDTTETVPEEILDITDDADLSDKELPHTQQNQNDELRREQELTDDLQAAVHSPAGNSNGMSDEITTADSADSDNAIVSVPVDQSGSVNAAGQNGNSGHSSDDSGDDASGANEESPEDDASTQDSQARQTIPNNPNTDPVVPGNPDTPTDPVTIEPTVKDVPRKIVTDGNGLEQSIPKDVFTVTAVGDAAPLVEMIGGTGRLMATSTDFTAQDGMGYLLCSDVQSGNVQTWWEADEEQTVQTIRDDYFRDLLIQSPDVCFDISTQSAFTSDQISQLASYGIGYVPLPELTSIANLKEAARIVAEVMDINSSLGIDARNIANNYINWIDNTLSEVQSVSPQMIVRSTGGGNTIIESGIDTYSFIYIDDWLDDITFSRTYEPGVYNNVKEFAWAPNGYGSGCAIQSTNSLMEQIMVIAGCKLGAITLFQGTVNLEDAFADAWHGTGLAFPYYVSFGIPQFSDEWASGFANPGRFLGSNKSVGSYGLGTTFFPAVVVSNDRIRSCVLNSPQWQPGQTDGSEPSDIQGSYYVYVNPVGFRNWAEGGIDSPLEAYWIAARITGRVDEKILKNRIQYFYESFFGVRLSDQQIDVIVNR